MHLAVNWIKQDKTEVSKVAVCVSMQYREYETWWCYSSKPRWKCWNPV